MKYCLVLVAANLTMVTAAVDLSDVLSSRYESCAMLVAANPETPVDFPSPRAATEAILPSASVGLNSPNASLAPAILRAFSREWGNEKEVDALRIWQTKVCPSGARYQSPRTYVLRI